MSGGPRSDRPDAQRIGDAAPTNGPRSARPDAQRIGDAAPTNGPRSDRPDAQRIGDAAPANGPRSDRPDAQRVRGDAARPEPTRARPPFRLLAITPPTGAVPADMLERWLAAGAREVGLAVLLREPGRAPRELLAADGRLAALRRRCRDHSIPLLLALDAAALGSFVADGLAGLHLRGDPDPAALARARPVPGDRSLRGRSCHGAPQPGHALVDYTLFAPVFPPTTAQPGAPLGSKVAAGLAALAAWTADPAATVFALGGVGPATARACLDAGAHGLAGIGVFFGEPGQVEQDVAALREIVAARDRHVEPVSPR